MIIKPRTRGFICLTSHPEGTAQNIKNQIEYVKNKGNIDGPKNVLVIGASTGFGISSRITAAFGSGAATIGVFFEKPTAPGKPGTAGWYNSAAFEKEAHAAGLYAKSINGYAFSDEVKASGYVVPEKQIDRTMKPYFNDSTGKYSAKIFRDTPESQKIAMRKSITDNLIFSRYIADLLGDSTQGETKTNLYGLKISQKENKTTI